MPAKKRTYNTRLIKRDYSYGIQEIVELFDLHKTTVRNWIKLGLPLIDKSRPYLIHGSELIVFLNLRQAKRKKTCKPHELFCFKCREPKASCEGLIDIEIRNPKLLQLIGLCATCSTQTFKAGAVNKLPDYMKIFDVQKMQGRHIIERTHPTLMCHFERTIKS
jgi:hypothetical protein